MIGSAPAQPALAAAVRAGQWAEVRSTAETMAQPLPPAVALVAARAAARTGAGRDALKILRDALPGAGELATALRLEGGGITLSRGGTPWPWVGPLIRGTAPAAQRRAAGELLRLSWQTLPVAILQQQRSFALPRALRRDLAATLAVRTGDVSVALRLLREQREDEPATRVAYWLTHQEMLPGGVRLAAAQALLAGGWWREAEALLAGQAETVPAHLRSSLAFVRGRAAYRRGKLVEAAGFFDAALAAAGTDEDRFAAAVQRARVAELSGDRPAALPFWDTARHAGAAEVEGWDGGARARVAIGRNEDALALLRRSPPQVLRVAGPRLAAMLIAKGDLDRAATVLARLSRRDPPVRALWVALNARKGNAAAVSEAAQLLADPRGGAWRSLVLDLLPAPAQPPADHVTPARDGQALATLAVRHGAGVARAALAAALAADPAWSGLVAGAALQEPEWSGPAHDLAAVGLDREAAALYAGRFPSASPAELAWSATTLAAWGNGPAALSAAERIESLLGDLPHDLLPDALLPVILPRGLTDGCAAAARVAGIHPAWVAAIVRRESRFDLRARSQAGAIGVAQLVPETARRLGAEPEELWDAGRSLDLAAREVARIAQRFGPHLPVVAAAYNAGDEVVMSWLAALGGTPDDVVFAAAVPYGETSDYVLAVCEGAALARYLE